VYENRALRKTFGHKREEIVGRMEKLLTEELYA
jgi:hypothetical protein